MTMRCRMCDASTLFAVSNLQYFVLGTWYVLLDLVLERRHVGKLANVFLTAG